MDRVRDFHAAVQRGLNAGALPDPASAILPAVQSAKAGRRKPTTSSLQYGSVFYHQYKLASLRRRDDHELFHADGWTRLSQFHVGGGWHGACNCSDSRHRAAADGNDWQLLGGLGSLLSLGVLAVLYCWLASAGVAGSRSEHQG